MPQIYLNLFNKITLKLISLHFYCVLFPAKNRAEPWDARAKVEPINVLGDDELHLAQLHEAGQGHVGPRRPRLVPTHVHVRLETPLLQCPDPFGAPEVGNAR